MKLLHQTLKEQYKQIIGFSWKIVEYEKKEEGYSRQFYDDKNNNMDEETHGEEESREIGRKEIERRFHFENWGGIWCM